MYDIEKLVSIVVEYLEAVENNRKYNLEVKKKKGYLPNECLWIPSMDGSTAFTLGQYYEREQRQSWALADVCAMLDVDQERLISAVKSMQRWERRRWRWDCSACLIGLGWDRKTKERFSRFISNEQGEHDYHTWYESTGRKKAWCV